MKIRIRSILGMVTVASLVCGPASFAQEAVVDQTNANSPATSEKKTEVAKNESGDDAGQDDLDAAMDQKVGADNLDKLTAVIEKCEEAIKKGLGEENTKFAKDLMASTSLDRAKMQIQEMVQSRLGAPALNRLQRRIVKDLEKAIEFNPVLGEAHVLIAKLSAREDIPRALKAMTSAIESFKDEPNKLSEAYFLRSALREDVDEKLSDLQEATKADPKNREAVQMMLGLLISKGKFDEVYESSKKLLEEDSDNIFAIGAAVDALMELDRRDDALKLLTQKIEGLPDSAPLYVFRGRLYIELKEFDKAIADATKVIELNGQAIEGYVLRANAYLQSVEKLNRTDDSKELALALKDVEKSLDLKPNLAEGIRLRAIIASQQKRYDEAIQDLTLLAKSNPQEPVWLLQLATLYQLDNRPSMAIKIADQLIRMNEKNWRAYRIRGDALLSMGSQLEATKDYQKALDRLDKEDEERSGLLNNLAWILATSPEDDLRDGKRSVELGTEACELTEFKEAHILSTLAAGYAEVGDFDKAIEYSEKAVESGKQENTDQLEQLEKELESYKEKKPWREKQDVKDKKKPIVNAGDAVET